MWRALPALILTRNIYIWKKTITKMKGTNESRTTGQLNANTEATVLY